MDFKEAIRILNNKIGQNKEITFQTIRSCFEEQNSDLFYQQIENELKKQGVKVVSSSNQNFLYQNECQPTADTFLKDDFEGAQELEEISNPNFSSNENEYPIDEKNLLAADFQETEIPEPSNLSNDFIANDSKLDEDLDLDFDPDLEIDPEDDKFSKENITKINSDIKIDDSVRMYLKEIGRIPLLSKEEEQKKTFAVFLGKEAKKKLTKFRNQEIDLSDQEVKQLESQIIQANQAKDVLVESNYRLVVSIAKRYIGRGVLFLDLIQEGNMGLMRAVDKFDYQKGLRLSTYATYWVIQGVTRAIADQARTIRIPVHIVETINKMSLCTRKLTQELKKKPTIEELAEKMNIPADKLRSIQYIEKKPISLEVPPAENKEDETSLGDFISDPNVLSPHEYMMKEVTQKLLDEVLENTLTEREEKVLKMRYGFLDGKVYTLEEIGNLFGVTRERIRQIESKALRRLRTPAKQSKLKSLYQN
ncbi:sigma-70 family RNA polymerase sigma factor [Candidatus Phytoplasma australiense]|nr:sigma-70 family RNA polymerase sigma factor [Candidatus Phytoplasma australiense]